MGQAFGLGMVLSGRLRAGRWSWTLEYSWASLSMGRSTEIELGSWVLEAHRTYGGQAAWRKGKRGRLGCNSNRGRVGPRESLQTPRVFYDTEATWEKSPYWVRHGGLCWIMDQQYGLGLRSPWEGSELKPDARMTRFDVRYAYTYRVWMEYLRIWKEEIWHVIRDMV